MSALQTTSGEISSGTARRPVNADPTIVRRIQRFSKWCAVAAGVLACAVLAGWLLDVSWMRTLSPAGDPVYLTSAVLMLLASAALGIVLGQTGTTGSFAKKIAVVFAGIVAGVSTVVLAIFASGSSMGLAWAVSRYGMRPLTACTLFLLGVSLLFRVSNGDRRDVLAQAFGFAGASIPVLALLQLSFGSAGLVNALGYRLIPLGTAAILAILGLGISLAQPDRGFLKAMTAELPQVALLRRFLFLALLFAVVLGLGTHFVERWHLASDAESDSIQTGVSLVAIALMVWWSARQIVGLENRRRASAAESESRYRELFEHNVAGVFRSTLDGRIVECNDALARIYGYDSVEELKTRRAQDLYPTSTARDEFVSLLRERRYLQNLELHSLRKDGTSIWTLENVALVERRGTEFLEGTMFDITDRRRDERALREAKEFSDNLIRTAIVMIVGLDSEARIEIFNEAAEKLTGYSEAELRGRSWFDTVVPKERFPRVWETFLEIKSGKRELPTVFENPILTKSGEERLISWQNSTVARGGKIVGSISFGLDVTEQSRVEAAMRASEERYRKLFDTSPESLILLSPDGTVVDVNPTAETLAGVSKFDWVDRPIIERIAQEDSGAIAEALRLSRGGQAIGPFAVKLETAGRGAVPVEFLVSPVIANGVATNILAIGRDVTERTKAEEEKQRLQNAIVESGKEWRETFDAIRNPILVVDDRGVIQRVNRAVEEISPGSFLELLGRPIEQFGEAQPWRKAAGLIQDLRGDTRSAEGMCQDELGGRYWEISVSRNSVGKTSRIIVVVRDVSKTVALQKSLRRSETMSAMGSIVAGVAHEVRNPLFAISATVDAFELRFGKTEEFRKYAEALRSQLERMKNLVQELFDFGKPAALHLVDTDFREVASRAISHCEVSARERGVEIRPSVPAGLPRLRADPDRLVQVLINLVENGIQHSNPGKSIAVSAKVEGRGGDPAIVCQVEDEGKGIPLDDLPRLFEPFFSRRSGGTGLGLAIVRRIVEEHGGAIDAANRAPAGAVFTFTLPLPDSSVPARAEEGTAS